MGQAAEKQEAPQQPEIHVESKLPVVSGNFDAIKASMETMLADYDTVVTEDTLPEARKDATYLNQLAKQIDAKRKEVKAPLLEPITEFEGRMNELRDLALDARKKITEQIDRFNEEKRTAARYMLEEERRRLWEEREVDGPHRRAEIDDLVTQTALTTTGNLTAKAANAVKDRVNEDRERQERVRIRLLELENASYRAGLGAPLTEDHVRPFLEADDDTYKAELDRILQAEITREQQAAERRRQTEERESAAQQQAQATTPPPNNQMGYSGARTPVEPEHPPAPAAEDGKVAWKVTATFHIQTGPGGSPEKVERAFHEKMSSAGITSLAAVTVERSA